MDSRIVIRVMDGRVGAGYPAINQGNHQRCSLSTMRSKLLLVLVLH
jgi:hypothetical protein